MTDNLEKASCPRDGCKVPSGSCLDGIEPWTQCPNVVGLPRAEKADAKIVRLAEGEPLAVKDAERLVQEECTRVIVVAGATSSGKSTLITSIYESFLEAPFAGCLFAGSETLPGFERVCHEGRVASGQDTAKTKRTNPRLGIRFYHMQVVSQSSAGVRTQLLIADMSGELFREARDASADAAKLGVLRRADRLTFLLDGGKLADPAQRGVAYHDARMILRVLAEERLFGRRTELDVVFAKWDLIQASGAETQRYVAHVQHELGAELSSKVAGLEFVTIAARPDTTISPFAFGVADVFRAWIGVSPAPYVPAADYSGGSASREFSRYGRQGVLRT